MQFGLFFKSCLITKIDDIIVFELIPVKVAKCHLIVLGFIFNPMLKILGQVNVKPVTTSCLTSENNILKLFQHICGICKVALLKSITRSKV